MLTLKDDCDKCIEGVTQLMHLYESSEEIHLQDTATVKSSLCSEHPEFAICGDDYDPYDINFLWLNDEFAMYFCKNTEGACSANRYQNAQSMYALFKRFSF